MKHPTLASSHFRNLSNDQDKPSPSSLGEVKVKYQDHVFQKMGVSGALVLHKHILFPMFPSYLYYLEIPFVTVCKHLQGLAITSCTNGSQRLTISVIKLGTN